jgi:pimeloyl-ACP methyl ester carboxylesterase
MLVRSMIAICVIWFLLNASAMSLILPARFLRTKRRGNTTIHVSPRISLDANATIHGDIIDDNSKGQRWLIYFNGNCSLKYQQDDLVAWLAHEYDCSVMQFDYRGTGASTGSSVSWRNLVEDGLATARHVLATYEPSHITLFGWSLGGPIAVQVAFELRDTSGTVSIDVVCDRSFLRIRDVVQQPLLRCLLATTLWNIDVTDAWDRIDEKAKKAFHVYGDGVMGDLPLVPGSAELVSESTTPVNCLLNLHCAPLFLFRGRE